MSEQPSSQRIATFVPDLMDQSKVGAAFPDAEKIRSASQLATAEADVVVVDLNRPGVLEALPELAGRGVRVIGFASHVDDDVIALAWAGGASSVLARSVFFKRLTEGTLDLAT